MGALVAMGFQLILMIVLCIIVMVVGLFLKNIMVFDSIALAIISGFLSHGLLSVHPAFALLIAIAVFFTFFLLQRTTVGFWIIASIMSIIWGFIFGLFANMFSGGDMIWTYVIWGLGIVVVFFLHLKARDNV